MKKPKEGTPIQIVDKMGVRAFVKREDMAVDPPAPPFSKIRGLYSHLKKLKSRGVSVVGYTETAISMAGWGVAWVCSELGMKAVLYDPQYKVTPPLLKFHRKQWIQFEPEIVPIPAGRAKVGYYISRKHLLDAYGPNAVMLGLGIPLEETIAETATEWRRTMDGLPEPPGTTVVNVGSGTICAGIVRGWKEGEGKIIGVLGRSGSIWSKTRYIQTRAGQDVNGLLGPPFKMIDQGWKYTEKSRYKSPFPCHPYYDMKAWEWLSENINNLEPPVLFWNIGRMK